MKFLDLFAGIGAFREGLERNGHEGIGFCEINKPARDSYKEMYDVSSELEFHDVTQLNPEDILKIGGVDIITAGFPCTPFTNSGRRLGFEDTRGTMFFEVIRLARALQPKIIFLENVKGLQNHDGGNTFKVICNTLEDEGYTIDYHLFNSKYFGAPQSRDRVFIVATKGYKKYWTLADVAEDHVTIDKKLVDILEATADVKYNLGGAQQDELMYKGDLDEEDINAEGIPIVNATKKGYLMAVEGDSVNISFPKSKTRRGRVGRQIANTIQAGETNQGVVLIDSDGNYRIRKFTPREMWRLQGFSDEAYDKASKVTSHSQLQKQAGNSITINVVEAIAKKFDNQ